MYKTLKEAIEGADDGSVIYLPGGAFEGNDTITKKLTIIGIGHKARIDNPDGNTIIGGNLYFHPGSDGSALIGCYVNGEVNIGNEIGRDPVNDILIRYNRIQNCVLVNNSTSGTYINQNYLLSSITSNFSTDKYSFANISNNIIKSGINYITNGIISNNIIMGACQGYGISLGCKGTTIINNIIFVKISCSNTNDISGNMMPFNNDNCDANPIIVGSGFDWSNMFVKYDSNPLNCDFHFKGEYTQYEDQVGIYAGTGFSDKQLAPVPYIVAKHVDEQTDAQGKLNIKVRVKASSEDE